MDQSLETLPGGPGNSEQNLHQASGLRVATQEGVFVNDDTCLASANLATATAWTVIPLHTIWGTVSTTTTPATYSPYRTRLPFPCTPCITFRQTNATPANNQVFSVRISGFDQFGQRVVETILDQTTANNVTGHTLGTPAAPWVRRTRIWCAKVFAVVDRIEYKASSLQSTNDWLDVGTYWDFDYSGNRPPYENYINQANQGVGTLLRVDPYGRGRPYLEAELLGVQLVNLDEQVHYLGDGTNTNPAVYALDASTEIHVVTNVSVANPTVVTVTNNHGMPTDGRFLIRIAGDTAQSFLNGEWPATQTGAATFSIPINVTAVHSSYAGIYAYVPPAIAPIDKYTPVIVGGLQSPNPATLNGFHQALFTTGYVFSIPLSATAAGTGGFVQVLRKPVADVQAYNSALTGQNVRGGFRIGTNATGQRGTPHKWNIIKAFATSANLNGTPLLTTEHRVDASTPTGIITQFPWPRGGRVGFRAIYRTFLGAGFSNASRSYAT